MLCIKVYHIVHRIDSERSDHEPSGSQAEVQQWREKFHDVSQGAHFVQVRPGSGVSEGSDSVSEGSESDVSDSE